MNNLHVERFSSEQVKKEKVLYILVFSLVVYVSNYFFNFMSAYIVIF
jgi:hypothetical protein